MAYIGPNTSGLCQWTQNLREVLVEAHLTHRDGTYQAKHVQFIPADTAKLARCVREPMRTPMS